MSLNNMPIPVYRREKAKTDNSSKRVSRPALAPCPDHDELDGILVVEFIESHDRATYNRAIGMAECAWLAEHAAGAREQICLKSMQVTCRENGHTVAKHHQAPIEQGEDCCRKKCTTKRGD
jgi:hypothetical protein